jgi:hypothetical protein
VGQDATGRINNSIIKQEISSDHGSREKVCPW